MNYLKQKLSGHHKGVGFSIIEVVLVLAIAGLIFLMVFIALPALRSSQRDTERKQAVGTIISNYENYISSNRGALFTGTFSNFVSSGTATSPAGSGALYKYLVNGETDYTNIAVKTVGTGGVSVSAGTTASLTNNTVADGYVIIYNGGSCGSVGSVEAGSAREFAVVGYVESGGGSTYCQGSN